ncbi:zinc finger AN1 domain-containing stress-associated protein 12 [Carex littledalei]|uniref:Zinc finger AN1 domain-containing stress-associated protein 12 n=1 Tax=Carex littledalei TaxID=544730 RepID=A0A833R583_9POAL|nr:zinc finger AN1 domain-containing stress-associated protein 12 [Carex littledalei]
MGGGTEAFLDLGAHCEQEDCKQLDFLPFTCDGCQMVFCLEHRTYKAHSCPKSEHKSRTVVICETCSMSIEKKFGEEEKAVLTRHERSGSCDPAKKQKPRCPVKRCKEVLTFSNCNTCKKCNLKVCLKHRFPSDHLCKGAAVAGAKLPIRMPVRNGLDCREKGGLRSPPPSVKAY